MDRSSLSLVFTGVSRGQTGSKPSKGEEKPPENKGERAKVRGSAWGCVGVRSVPWGGGLEVGRRGKRVEDCGQEETEDNREEKSVGGGVSVFVVGGGKGGGESREGREGCLRGTV